MSAPLEVDYYAILEVDETADSDAIKRAFRRLCLLKHPDKNSGNPNAHVAFCALNDAYDTLRDSSRRILYNAKYPRIKQQWDEFRRTQEDECTRQKRQESEKVKIERLLREYNDALAMSVKKAEKLAEEKRKIAQIREDIAKKEVDIESIKESGRARIRLEKQGQGWVKYWTTGWLRTGEEIEREKIERDQENLQKVASERIKVELLTGQKIRLQQNETNQQDQVSECESQAKVWREKTVKAQEAWRLAWQAEEHRRVAEQYRAQEEERKRKEKDRLAREAKEAAERKKAAEEREQQEQERRRKEAEEWERYIRQIAAENMRRAKAERVAEEKKKEVEEIRKNAQRRAGMYAESRTGSGVRGSQTKTGKGMKASMPGRGTKSQHKQRNTGPGSSVHPRFWPKVQGSNRCRVCAKQFHLFVLQCPQCDMMACAGCKRIASGPCEREEISNTSNPYDFEE